MITKWLQNDYKMIFCNHFVIKLQTLFYIFTETTIAMQEPLPTASAPLLEDENEIRVCPNIHSKISYSVTYGMVWEDGCPVQKHPQPPPRGWKWNVCVNECCGKTFAIPMIMIMCVYVCVCFIISLMLFLFGVGIFIFFRDFSFHFCKLLACLNGGEMQYINCIK